MRCAKHVAGHRYLHNVPEYVRYRIRRIVLCTLLAKRFSVQPDTNRYYYYSVAVIAANTVDLILNLRVERIYGWDFST